MSDKKLIIAGSRTIDKYRAVFEFLKWITAEDNDEIQRSLDAKHIISGCCPTGPDQVPFLLKKIRGMDDLNILKFPADWDTHGKAAGPIRNKEMAEEGDVLLLIWDGKSAGSKSMKKEMKALGKPVYEIIVDK